MCVCVTGHTHSLETAACTAAQFNLCVGLWSACWFCCCLLDLFYFYWPQHTLTEQITHSLHDLIWHNLACIKGASNCSKLPENCICASDRSLSPESCERKSCILFSTLNEYFLLSILLLTHSFASQLKSERILGLLSRYCAVEFFLERFLFDKNLVLPEHKGIMAFL